MKFRYLILLLAICMNAAWAEFAWAEFNDAVIQLHPNYPNDGPFVLELRDNWPTDCHPGEQNPVIEDYDGDSVLIEFDVVVIHITCNQTVTPYRVLVDMSDVVGTVPGSFSDLEVTVRFGDAEFTETVLLECDAPPPCLVSPASNIRPEAGLYTAASLENQGMILDRQNGALVAYPLIYDESGSSEWLIAGGRIVEDTFFADLSELTGGQCLGCPLPQQSPVESPVGKLTLLMESEGTVLAKVNDGQFIEYQSLVFGYETFPVGEVVERALIDLEGRWGLSENRGTSPPLGDLTEFFPGAFDLVREDIVNIDDGIQPDFEESYLLSTVTGENLGRLVCKGQTDTSGNINICQYFDPADTAEPLFLFYQEGPSTLSIEYARSVIAIGTAPGGKAVRLD